jgi:MFS transporter, ACS family, glucarate transporter
MARPTSIRLARPTSIRYLVLGLATLVAVMLYLDRYCLGFLAPYLSENLGLSRREIALVLDAFFYTYAFGQILCGWLSDRYGARVMLAVYLAVWSSLTGLMGLAQGLTALLLFRLGCGLFEAGAYPACAGLVRRWFPYQRRGLASSIVSIGGRIGQAVVPVLSAFLLVFFVPVSAPSWFSADDLLDLAALDAAMTAPPPTSADAATLTEIIAPRVRPLLSDAARAVLAEAAAGSPDQPFIPTPRQLDTIVQALNQLLVYSDLIDGKELEKFRHKLDRQAVQLADSKLPLDRDQLARRNRLVLEKVFPNALRKIYGEAWRAILVVYGAPGVLLALVFWLLVRDGPRRHPWCNDAEARLIEENAPATVSKTARVPAAQLWQGILTSRSLWVSAFVQFGTNFGWVFLGQLFPLYLQRVYQVPELQRGVMVMLPSLVSLPMMLVGGWWTDRMTRALGARWGRSLPIASTRLVAASAFLSCLWLDSPWSITAALCLFSLTSDMGLPSMWAYCLDVGGRNVGLVLAWGNMWGNLGAAISTSTLVRVEGHAGWNAVFLTCGAVFVIIGLAALFIDATKPIAAPRGAEMRHE